MARSRSARTTRFLFVGLPLAMVGCGAGAGFLGGGDFSAELAQLSIGQRFGGYARLTTELLMTSDQQRQARDIDTKLSQDIDALRTAAKDQFVASLNADQQTLYAELGNEFPRIDTLDRLADDSSQDLGALFGSGNRISVQTVETRLALSPDQASAFEGTRQKLTDDIKARRQSADDEFRAILDAGQIQLLDDLLSRQEHPFGA